MKHEDFKDWIEKNCMYETFYEDSEGRIIMILTELDAWAMCNKFAEIEREECAKMCDDRVTAYQYATDPWAREHIDEAKHLAETIRARGQNNG